MNKKDDAKLFKDILKLFFAILCITAYVILLLVLLYSYKAIECEIDDKFTLFRDLLAIILSIAGVAIAAVGIGIYQLILHVAERKLNIWEGEFQDKMDKRYNDYLRYANSIVSLNIGHSIWLSYEADKKDTQLQKAITITRSAYNDILRLDKQKRTNEVLKCQILNNLGYYLAERGNPEDREFAKQCAEFIVKRIHKFPHQSGGWQHTANFIKSVYNG